MKMRLGLFLILIFLSHAVFGVGMVQYKEETSLKELTQSLEEEKQILEETEREKRKVLSHVYELKKKLKKAAHDKSRLSDQMIHFRANVNEIAGRVADLEQILETQKKKLKRRLRVLYKLSGRGYLQVLFSSQSSANLDKNLLILKKITESDYKLVSDYQTNVTALKNKRQNLKDQVRQLLSVEDKIKTQEKQLKKLHVSKRSYIANLEKKRRTRLKKLKGLRTKSISLFGSEVINEVLEPSFFEKKGKLEWPVDGRIMQEFGIITDAEIHTRTSHKGLFFTAIPGSHVKAVSSGKVKYSGFLKGSGKTVIIDHGNSYYTVYSNLKKLLVKEGEKVNSLSHLGFTGLGNGRFAAGLYFELRHFSEPIDPQEWLQSDEVRSIRAQNDSIEESKEEI